MAPTDESPGARSAAVTTLRRRVLVCVVAASLLAGALVSLRHVSRENGLVWDEMHLWGIGAYLWRTGRFDLDGVVFHPPLSFYLNSAPLLGVDILLETFGPFGNPAVPETLFKWNIVRGKRLIAALGYDAFLASHMPFMAAYALLGLLVFRWAQRWWGGTGGLTCPLLFATLQFLVLTLECPGPVPLLGFLGASALAPTAKFTGLLVGPLAAACVVVAAARGSRAVYVPFVGGRARLLGYWAGIGVLATAATYGALVLAYQGEWALTTFRNGIRLIYRHVTGKGHPIFLDSRISGSGFREYYLRAILYKTPTTTLAAFVLALLVPTGAARARWLVPAGLGALVLGYFSLSGYTLGLRYPLVVFPLLYVAGGRLAAPGGRQRVRRAGAAAIVLLTLEGTSSPPSRSGRMGTGCHRSLPPCSGSSSR